jgi:D,D-heptose 1,7-bisphosphate phosphatase
LQAVILAGGKGTRLGTLTKDIPKPMIEVAGKPILLHQIELCKRYGITKIQLIVNHLYESIQDYFGDGSKFGVEINYFIEPTALGTVGGIKAIEAILTETFLVIYGDVLVNMNLDLLIKYHQNKKSDTTLVLHPNDHPFDSDLVDIDASDKITSFYSKPHQENTYYRNLVNAGLYIFEPSILAHLEKDVKADFGKDIFPLLFSKINMYGYNTTEYLKDMGTPDRLDKVTNDLLSGKIERSNFDHNRACIFLDRDGVLNKEVDLIHTPEQLELYDFTATAIKKINSSEYISVVVTNQSVIARNLTDEAGLRIIHNKLEWLLGLEHTKIDDIYYCPHHPHGGFEGENKAYKIECECRKPKSGMLLQAKEKYHIDLQKSWIIGDTERDIIAGKNVGCTTIGVRTGYGCKHLKTPPDYMFANVLEAVNFIIDQPFENIYQTIFEKYSLHQTKKPFVINIGGNTGSGKSTLTTYLQKEFEKQQIKVLRIDLDDWILPKEEREHAKDVFERFNILQLIKDVFAIMNGHEIKVKKHWHDGNLTREEKSYKITDEQIIIVEGIVAMSMPQLRGISHCKVYKKIDSATLHAKFKEFYTWKGYDSSQIDTIFEKRIKDEYELIEYDEQFAHIIA